MPTPEEPHVPDEAERFTSLLPSAKRDGITWKPKEGRAEFTFALSDGCRYLAVFLQDQNSAEHKAPSMIDIVGFFLSILRQCTFTYDESDAIYKAKTAGWKIAAEKITDPPLDPETFLSNALGRCNGDMSRLFSQN